MEGMLLGLARDAATAELADRGGDRPVGDPLG
jgi:hypothetical protein